MTEPVGVGGRPLLPAPGMPAAAEMRIATIRAHARRLFWSALILIAVAGACGYFYDNLPAGLEDWMLFSAAGAVVLLLVVIPFVRWRSKSWTVTTERVLARSGVLRVRRRELRHVRGYTIAVRRGLLQRMWGAGTLTLSNGVDEPLRMTNIPHVMLVHETLVDQVEVSQILAHRDAQSAPDEPEIPPRPPAPPAPVV
ncbi:PH domain-containing protein [Microbacterium sp. C7(2022)]|uniref:PH domain-containing protein n=1 Tax=Microbacterium sp. C7(2022) TaxID=2992759 RepID=UPI00237BDE45|nr:PH domain-containing protein [Microbacterium sp. C7(2022)]MDE0547332.1 PH domain-containing protein [Microbacterium sp. C7(2022)]